MSDAAERRRPPRDDEVKITYERETLYVKLGDGPVQITDGYGGWEEVERPADLSLTRWAGQTPLRLSLPLLLDGYRNRESVQRDLRQVLKLGRTADGDEEPPVFRVSGSSVPFSGSHWVMEEAPEMGETIRSKQGRLLRQFLTVSLLEYVRPDRIKIKRRRGGAKTYTTRNGDTLLSIANDVRPGLNGGESIELAHTIAILNDLRDIRKRLDAGIRLRLP